MTACVKVRVPGLAPGETVAPEEKVAPPLTVPLPPIVCVAGTEYPPACEVTSNVAPAATVTAEDAAIDPAVASDSVPAVTLVTPV